MNENKHLYGCLPDSSYAVNIESGCGEDMERLYRTMFTSSCQAQVLTLLITFHEVGLQPLIMKLNLRLKSTQPVTQTHMRSVILERRDGSVRTVILAVLLGR
ncbi:unnamed protein product [Protopolystoma xenopodis]|uniref:Uncharacterized protein n=1 Tax=Protopolystoma xenopodis TaxID=117903 RepID=A0A3S5AXW1_9PLAT|nr:unnamed protein product [Protopolystoma xenopodis]VEL43289.1 unnamed protein product [Protopolystoma xenopodis]